MEKLVKGLIVALIVLLIISVVLIVLASRKPTLEPCRSPRNNFNINARIIGGHTVSINSYPFMAGAIIKKDYGLDQDYLQCGCSIISSHWVLTAAHCIILLETYGKELVYISSGSAKWINGAKHDIVDWVHHVNYQPMTMTNDIALIRVRQSLKGRYSQPIPLASSKYQYSANKQVTVAGWGLTNNTNPFLPVAALRAVNVFIYNQTYCEMLYRKLGHWVTDTMFCAGVSEGGKDACQFDSGGPIFDGYLAIGIVSWGVNCSLPDKPGVYTRINIYKDWIKNTTKAMKIPSNAKFQDEPSKQEI